MIEQYQKKKQLIAEAIEKINAGELINVVDASGWAYGVCIGDFRDIGWSERCTTVNGMWYEWKGPLPIMVEGNVIQPGGCTEFVEMDWS